RRLRAHRDPARRRPQREAEEGGGRGNRVAPGTAGLRSGKPDGRVPGRGLGELVARGRTFPERLSKKVSVQADGTVASGATLARNRKIPGGNFAAPHKKSQRLRGRFATVRAVSSTPFQAREE